MGLGPALPVGIVLAVLSFGMFTVGTTSLVVLGLAGPMLRDLGAAPGLAGGLLATFAFTFAFSAPMMQSLLGGRVPPRGMIVAGLILLAAGSFWGALAGSVAELFASRVVAALGGALIGPSSSATASLIVPPERRGRALAAVFGGFTLASVLGVPLATWMGQLLGWRGAIAGIGALGLVAAVAAFLILPRRPPPAPVSLRALARLLADPPLAAGYGVTILNLTAQFSIFGLMGLLLVDHFGLAQSALPAALLGFGIGGVAGNAVAGIMTDRLGAKTTVIVSFAGLLAMAAALCLPLGPLAAALVVALGAGFGTMFAAPQQSHISSLGPEAARGTILALNSSAGYVGLALGSALAAAVVDRIGYGALGPASLAAGLPAILLFLWSIRRKSR